MRCQRGYYGQEPTHHFDAKEFHDLGNKCHHQSPVCWRGALSGCLPSSSSSLGARGVACGAKRHSGLSVKWHRPLLSAILGHCEVQTQERMQDGRMLGVPISCQSLRVRDPTKPHTSGRPTAPLPSCPKLLILRLCCPSAPKHGAAEDNESSEVR